jgi:alanyl-tRNA synthetase
MDLADWLLQVLLVSAGAMQFQTLFLGEVEHEEQKRFHTD